MVIQSFVFSRIPTTHFGAGKFNILDSIISHMGKTALFVTGTYSFESSGRRDLIDKTLKKKSVAPLYFPVKGEPSPDLIDDAVSQFKSADVDIVCSIGGGSVIDTGKAISAMLLHDDSVFDYLEGVGTGKKHDGVKVPFIAVPTTAGTGSEATKNAVLRYIGPNGFKKSLRHDNFVPDVVVIDPELALSCPPDITAASGMDAFTQLLESYVSAQSTPLTDTLAFSGLCYTVDNLIQACTTGARSVDVRAGMAYGAFLSGITLATAGLGIVHGLASALGGLFDIPHGVICGTLVGAATKVTVDKLKRLNDNGEHALKKYARVGALLSKINSMDTEKSCGILIQKIEEWTDILNLPLLSEFGVKKSDIENILDRTGNKNNPVKLDRNEIRLIIESRL